MRTEPTISQLQAYINYLNNVYCVNTVKKELVDLKESIIDNTYEPDVDEVDEDSNYIEIIKSVDIESFSHFNVEGDWQSNDEGSSYFSPERVEIAYGEEWLNLGYAEAESLIEALCDYDDFLENNNQVMAIVAKPFEIYVETV